MFALINLNLHVARFFVAVNFNKFTLTSAKMKKKIVSFDNFFKNLLQRNLDKNQIHFHKLLFI